MLGLLETGDLHIYYLLNQLLSLDKQTVIIICISVDHLHINPEMNSSLNSSGSDLIQIENQTMLKLSPRSMLAK